jgi:hypothetical protein
MVKEESKRKRDKRIPLQERLVSALTSLQGIYEECTEQEFLDLFNTLGAERLSAFAVLDIVRNFQSESRKIKVPAYFEMARIQKACDRWVDFRTAISNFKKKQKGARGGLRAHRDYIKEIKEDRVLMMKEYRRLLQVKKKGSELPSKEKRTFEYYQKRIPENIIKKIPYHGTSTLAIEWLAGDIGCPFPTLKDIIYRNPVTREQ